MSERPTLDLGEVFTETELRSCIGKEANWICEYVVKPRLDLINLKSGQENDPKYIAYAIQYALSQVES